MMSKTRLLFRIVFYTVTCTLHIDNIFNIFYFSFIVGHRLVIHMSDIALVNNDNSTRLAHWIIGLFIGMSFILNSITLFGSYYYRIDSESIAIIVYKRFRNFLLFCGPNFQFNIFIYCMVIYKRQLMLIESRFQKPSEYLLYLPKHSLFR